MASKADRFYFDNFIGAANCCNQAASYLEKCLKNYDYANIKKMLPYIGHFHSADVPGRHELETGEINWAYLIAEIEKMGYDRYFGLEYLTTKDTTEGLPKRFF